MRRVLRVFTSGPKARGRCSAQFRAFPDSAGGTLAFDQSAQGQKKLAETRSDKGGGWTGGGSSDSRIFCHETEFHQQEAGVVLRREAYKSVSE